MELSDRGPSRPESNRLLLDMLTPLLDKRPSPSLPILTLLEKPRTSLRPLLFPLPPSPVPAGPAPADTVVQTKIAAPVRTHTRITPQVTNIVPQINVQNYNVDVPVAVPRAVPREIVLVSHVAKPYEVPVPRAVHVPAPYKVHPVQEIVETPHIHHATVETHSSQAVVTAHATPVHAVSHVPVAAAAPVAAVHAAPAAVGYAGYAGHAIAAPAAVGYAGYAGHAIAAPALGYAGHAVAAPAVVA